VSSSWPRSSHSCSSQPVGCSPTLARAVYRAAKHSPGRSCRESSSRSSSGSTGVPDRAGSRGQQRRSRLGQVVSRWRTFALTANRPLAACASVIVESLAGCVSSGVFRPTARAPVADNRALDVSIVVVIGVCGPSAPRFALPGGGSLFLQLSPRELLDRPSTFHVCPVAGLIDARDRGHGNPLLASATGERPLQIIEFDRYWPIAVLARELNAHGERNGHELVAIERCHVFS